MKLSKAEKETITCFDCASDMATTYTANPVMMRKFDKHPAIYHLVKVTKNHGNVVSKTYQHEIRFLTYRTSDRKRS